MTYTRYLKKIINKEIKLKPELHIIRTGMVLGKTKMFGGLQNFNVFAPNFQVE